MTTTTEKTAQGHQTRSKSNEQEVSNNFEGMQYSAADLRLTCDGDVLTKLVPSLDKSGADSSVGVGGASREDTEEELRKNRCFHDHFRQIKELENTRDRELTLGSSSSSFSRDYSSPRS